jgi:DNA-binding LytR/AlgR family response regulator
MKQVRAIIADDEEPLRTYLRKKLSALWPELEIIGEAGDGEAALRQIEKNLPDIAFLDVQMPGCSGIEVARRSVGTCLFVFVTAFDKYAMEAFDSAAIDYLLKPVSDERLAKTVARLKERLGAGRPDMSAALEQAALSIKGSPDFLQWIKATHKDGVRLIPANDIYYFKATDKYTTVRTRDHEFLIRTTIKELEEALDPGQFWRVHRASIVNVKTIDTVGRSLGGGGTIFFKDIKDRLSISRAYSRLFKQM